MAGTGLFTFFSVLAGGIAFLNREGGAGLGVLDRPKITVSHVDGDYVWADWLRRELEYSGFQVRLADRNVATENTVSAGRWRRPRVAILLSPAALAIGGLDEQLVSARRWRLLVIRVDHTPIPAALADELLVDLSGVGHDIAREMLLNVLAEGGMPPPKILPADPSIHFPGHGAAISNIAHRNPNFTGRRHLLDYLYQQMTSTGDVVLTQAQAIHGLGGIGKTQLALEYAHLYGGGYRIIWWIPAEQPAAIVDALQALAGALELPTVANQKELLAALWVKLRSSERWLLVFDNAEDPDLLRTYWPPEGGHVLVTSRSGNWRDLVSNLLQVDVLSRAEAVELLRHRTHSEDVAAANEVADELGDLPLALAQAAAYADETHTTLADYLQLLRTRRSDIFGFGKPTDYDDTVLTTWSMSLSKAEEKAPGSRELLTLFSYLAPDDIPRQLIYGHADRLPQSLAAMIGDRVHYDLIIRALTRYSLMIADSDRISVHRLVQLTVRRETDPAEQIKWAKQAVLFADHSFPEDIARIENWPACTRLLSHVLFACDRAEELGVRHQAMGRMLHRAARYLHWRAEYAQSWQMFERALDIRRTIYGPSHLEVADTLSSFSRLCFHLADLDRALQEIERALDIRRRELGDRHHLVGEDLCHMGRILREMTRLPQARNVTQQALLIQEDCHGPASAEAAECVDLLGVILWRQGDLEGSRQLHLRALRDRQTIFGGRHLEVGESCKHLGVVCRDLGRLPEAEEYLELGNAIMEETFGAEHLETIAVLSRLADVKRRLGEAALARSMLERAISGRSARLGEHPDVALCLTGLGAALRDLGLAREAREAVDRALRIYERTYGADHPYCAESMTTLGPILRLLGEPVVARRTLERAMDIFERNYGQDHHAIAEVLECLVPVLREAGELAPADRYARRALRIRARAAGYED